MDRFQCDWRQTCDCRQAIVKACTNKAPARPGGDTRATLARVVSAWMKAHGHPLKCVAGRLGVAESTICQWAHGKRFPSPENLDDLARCAGVPTLCLFCPHLVRIYEAVAQTHQRHDPCRTAPANPAAGR